MLSLLQKLKDHNIILKNGSVNPKFKILLNKHAHLKQELINRTAFIEDKTEYNLRERLYCIINDITSPVLCQQCNEIPVKFIKDGKKRNTYHSFCSLQCSNRNTDVKIKKQKSYKKSLGVENPSQSSKIKQQKIETTQKNFGVDFPMQSAVVRKKSIQSIKNKHGADNIMRVHHIKQRNMDSKKRSQYYINITQQPHYKKLSDFNWLLNQHHTLQKSATQIANELSVCQTTVLNWLHQHNIQINNYTSSGPETELVDFLKQQNIKNIICNTRSIIAPYELDILLPDYNIAIEYNGIFWHSEDGTTNSRIHKNYHLNKTKMCHDKNIQLIHIFETDWQYKREIVQSKILHSINKSTTIGARNCQIGQLNAQQSNQLGNKWHIQGGKAGEVNLALIYNNEPVAVMTFGKSRFNHKYQWEMLRYCSKLNTTIVGGANKLYKHFIKHHNPSSVISYCDLRWGNGNMYTHLGFIHSHLSEPNYYYVNINYNDIKLHSRLSFQKHKLKDKLDQFDPSLTEAQNMFNNRYRRIWDCGNSVWVWYR